MKAGWKTAFGLMAALSLPSASAVTLEEVHDKCSKLSELAHGLMDLRQAGVPMPKAMDAAQAAGPPLTEPMRLLVSMAYDLPRQPTERARADSAVEFQNKAYAACYASGEKKIASEANQTPRK